MSNKFVHEYLTVLAMTEAFLEWLGEPTFGCEYK